jgi:glutamine cyclotransferase
MVWESTGEYGISVLRRYRLGADRDEDCGLVPPEMFAEGICPAGDDGLWQLTWREGVALRWRLDPLTLVEQVAYDREGWGICAAGDCVMTSDGSSELVRRDPVTLRPLGTVVAHCGDRSVTGLNDLAWSGGLVWANVMARPYLAGIDPATGSVVEVVDARPVAERHWRTPQAVMNGIAALPAPAEFLLTGKTWRWIYHVRLAAARSRRNPLRLLTG